MKVLVIGTAGLLGRKISEKLAAMGVLSSKKVRRLTMADVITPPAPADSLVEIGSVACDLSVPAAENAIANHLDIFFQLAAVAVKSFDDIMRVNIEDERARKI